MKKRFYTHLGYIYGSIIIIIIGLLGFLLPLISLVEYYNDQTTTKYILIIIFFFINIYFVIILGSSFIQWVVIDDRKIVARSLLKTILEVKWNDVKNIYIDSYAFSHKNGFFSRWIVFDDGRNNTFEGSLNIKKGFIKIKYSKKNLKIIKKYWKDEILDNKKLIT